MSDENRLFIKAQLVRLIEQKLTVEDDFSTEQQSRIYGVIQQLEGINPNPQPLTLENLPKIVGNWQILYSIKRNRTAFGTETTSNRGTGIDIRIRQDLTLDNVRTINACNSFFIELTAFEQCKIEVEGVLNIKSDKTVLVKLKTFEFQLTQLFILPGLKIPFFDLFPTENLWTISYLDEDMMLGRDDSGTSFVFRKRI